MLAESPPRKRLGIIGAGSSGLITLKHALDALPDWDITVFERTDHVRGCWGSPRRGFVSTSTKFTTQFACFPRFDASTEPARRGEYEAFYRDDEFGQYLDAFADAFDLRRHIRFNHAIERIEQVDGRWRVTARRGSAPPATHAFDTLVLCTGLAATPRPLTGQGSATVTPDLSAIRDTTVVVIGGGESAADHALALADPELGNRVYLSLRSGMRVSPRYHPIRGVPSDFLRTRLMLSIDRRMRNRIGQWFVEFRMRQASWLRWLFPSRDRSKPNHETDRGVWARKLMAGSSGKLFDVFHNKNDDILDALVDGRVSLLGPPTSDDFSRFRAFGDEAIVDIRPDYVVPSVGFQSTVDRLSNGTLYLRDFYLSCQSVTHPDLFAVGFARPIIGNIPSISELQARYIVDVLADRIPRPADIAAHHARDRRQMEADFPSLNLDNLYPVEMFTYCDRLARLIGAYPTLRSMPWRDWVRMQLGPATTLHYSRDDPAARDALNDLPIYLPVTLIALLMALKPIDWLLRLR